MPFYFQGYRILSILLPGIWDTMFNFSDTAIFPPKYTNTKYININHLNFSTKEEKLYVHDMTSLSRPTFRQSITCSVNALIIYSLTKDVEGGGGG